MYLHHKIRIPLNPERNKNISLAVFGRINEKVEKTQKLKVVGG